MILTDEEIKQQSLNEETTKLNIITPIIQDRWGKNTFIMEYYFTDGRINVSEDNEVTRGKKKKADYLLLVKNNVPLAIVEAKGQTHDASEGSSQVQEYAEILDIPFAYATNGIKLIEFDRVTGIGNDTLYIEDFPYADDLWNRYVKEKGFDDEELKLIEEPYYEDNSGAKVREPRYYQRIAINRVVEGIAKGNKRMLLVMATGTGKTFTAFQIVWRLHESKKMKKILYLVDRNILADQTMMKDFKPFQNSMVKIDNSKIKSSTGYEIYVGLYQQLKTPEKDYYKQFDKDFFDLIIVDECHRSSASYDSPWHEILEYFSSATQIGLTATPKETQTISNSNYFGEPIYEYSLLQGIEDGFLAPYRVIAVQLDIDKQDYVPSPGETDLKGNPLDKPSYSVKEFDRNFIVNSRRDIVAKRITDYLIDNNCRYEKTIVFCETEEHAAAMTLRLQNLNKDLMDEDSRYIMQITGNCEEGKAQLDNFIDPSSKYPVIAVTSRLLSTGVDAVTCKLIVLDKSIGSMTEFKQIIGRGTRVREKYEVDDEIESKMFFTILDFRKNYENFNDPSFDGKPIGQIEQVDENDGFKNHNTNNNAKTPAQNPIEEKIYVNGKQITIDDETQMFLDEKGKLVKENLQSAVKNNIITQFPTYEEFYQAFMDADNKDLFLEPFAYAKNYIKKVEDNLGGNLDLFDVIRFIGYDIKPLTKEERISKAISSGVLDSFDTTKQDYIKGIIDSYKIQKFSELKSTKIFGIPQVQALGYVGTKAIKTFFNNNKQEYLDLMIQIENKLYEEIK